MNKRYHHHSVVFAIMLSLASWTLISCGSDDEYTPYKVSDIVVESSTNIAPEGGNATLVLRETGCKATVDVSWLSIQQDGTTLTLTAPANEELQSRNALLTIEAPSGDVTKVSISQEGQVFILKAEDVVTDDKAFEGEAAIEATNAVTVVRTPQWIKASVEDKRLHYSVEANTTGKMREGYIVLKGGMAQDSIRINQCEYADLFGNYTLEGHNPFSDKDVSYAAKIERGPEENQYYLWLTRYSWRMIATYNQADHSVSLASAQLCGTFSQWFVFLCMYDHMSGYMTASKAVSVTGIAKIDKDTQKQVIPFKDNGSWKIFNATTLSFLAYNTRDLSSSSGVAGTVVAFTDARLVRK